MSADTPEYGTNEPPLNRTFDTEANLYDNFRPGYFDSVFDTIIEKTSLKDGATVLEVGCGAGQATLPMAARGYQLTALEPGLSLAALTREKLAAYSNVQLMVSTLEEAVLPEASFDLVYSAMALHWVAPEVRFAKSHRLLKQAGHLAIMYSEPVSDEKGDEFYKAALPIVQKHGFVTEPADFLPVKQEALGWNSLRTGFDTELFEPLGLFIFLGSRHFPSSSHYLGFLHTLSKVIALPETKRNPLLSEIGHIIDSQFGGQLNLRFATTLALAQKK